MTYSCQVDALEDALDVLTLVVLEGHKVLKACLIDDGSRTELPVEAFDGHPIAVPIRRLEKQWQSVLQEPCRPQAQGLSCQLERLAQRNKACEKRIALLELAGRQVEETRRRVEQTKMPVYRKRKLIRRYDRVLTNYRQSLSRVLTSQQAILNQLNKLERSNDN